MLFKGLKIKKFHIFYLIIVIAVAVLFHLIVYAPPSPEKLTVKDPEIREKTAIKIIKANERSLKIEDKYLPELLNALKDESKNVRLATLKVLRVAKKESTIPEIIKLFTDKEEEVREGAIEGVAIFGEVSSKYVIDTLFTEDKQKGSPKVEKDYREECSVITLIKIDKFDSILKSNDAKLIKIGADYCEKTGNEEGLGKLASYYLEKENYKDAAMLYEKLGKEQEGNQKIADKAFKKMNYETAALYYEKAGDTEKAAESRKRIIKDGEWVGDRITFTVSSKGRKIIYMEVTIPFSGGKTTTYIRNPIEVKNNSFYYNLDIGAGFTKVEGKFISAIKAVGSASFSHIQYGAYGQSFAISGSTNWSANFKK